ncbi:DUF4368 domain-containing protein [Clostridium kluyveri]|uniref:DUF4368 domain-containing protein n=1 Tax=Clostridium kluyveri TaxID=1534 RepID=UPI0009D7164E
MIYFAALQLEVIKRVFNALIERIAVYEDGHKSQWVDIYYKFVRYIYKMSK